MIRPCVFRGVCKRTAERVIGCSMHELLLWLVDLAHAGPSTPMIGAPLVTDSNRLWVDRSIPPVDRFRPQPCFVYVLTAESDPIDRSKKHKQPQACCTPIFSQ